jgi:AhpD family alkylhydroperoxidase
VLRLLRDELEIAMALTGCRTLADAHGALADTAGEKRSALSPRIHENAKHSRLE